MRFIFFLFLISIILLISNVEALGVSPPRVVIEDIPKEFTIEKSVILSGIDKGNLVSVSLSGEGSQWVESKLGEEFIFSNDEEIELPFIFSIPKKAPNGEYEVLAQVVATPNQEGSGLNSAVVSSGVLVSLKFTITGKEVKDYRITNVKISDLETNNPLIVIMTIDNKGNVLVKPQEVEITIKDKDQNIITTASTKDVSAVEPYSLADSTAVFNNVNLNAGFYFVDIIIHKDGEIKEVGNVPLDVLEQGSLKAKGEFTHFEVEGHVDKIAKINAHFSNQGEVDLHPVLKGEVYSENTLIEIFELGQQYVGKTESKTFTHYYTLPSPGEYTIKAHFEYLSKRTQTKEVTFKNGEAQRGEEEEASQVGLEIDGFTIISIIVIILIAYLGVFKKKKKVRHHPSRTHHRHHHRHYHHHHKKKKWKKH